AKPACPCSSWRATSTSTTCPTTSMWCRWWIASATTGRAPRCSRVSRPSSASASRVPKEELDELGHTCAERAGRAVRPLARNLGVGDQPRSEEHTSELQSLAYLVC